MDQQRTEKGPAASGEAKRGLETPPDAGQREPEEPAVLKEVIIETLAIDGICGVY